MAKSHTEKKARTPPWRVFVRARVVGQKKRRERNEDVRTRMMRETAAITAPVLNTSVWRWI